MMNNGQETIYRGLHKFSCRCDSPTLKDESILVALFDKTIPKDSRLGASFNPPKNLARNGSGNMMVSKKTPDTDTDTSQTRGTITLAPMHRVTQLEHTWSCHITSTVSSGTAFNLCVVARKAAHISKHSMAKRAEDSHSRAPADDDV